MLLVIVGDAHFPTRLAIFRVQQKYDVLCWLEGDGLNRMQSGARPMSDRELRGSAFRHTLGEENG